jgi:hypothetical protein
MKRIQFSSIWGLLLITAGVLFLLQGRAYIRTGNAEDNRWALVWAVLFAASAVTCLWAYLTDRVSWWWTVIPGTILLGLALIITLGVVGGVPGDWIAALWLASISLGFWIVYLNNRERWWAVIPGGALLTVAVIPLLAGQFQGEAIVATLFLGMALTFGLVYLLPSPQGRMTWALIPAGILAMFGGAFMLAFTTAINYIVALVIILAGLYLLLQQLGGRQRARRH